MCAFAVRKHLKYWCFSVSLLVMESKINTLYYISKIRMTDNCNETKQISPGPTIIVTVYFLPGSEST